VAEANLGRLSRKKLIGFAGIQRGFELLVQFKQPEIFLFFSNLIVFSYHLLCRHQIHISAAQH